MKYLFIILIAFSFIGCDDEDGENNTNPNRTIYAIFTMPTNNDNIWQMSGICGPSSFTETSENFNTPLASGLTASTDPYVVNYVPANVVCSVSLVGQGNVGQNTAVEISLYVDGELYETRVVTGTGSHNFIVN